MICLRLQNLLTCNAVLFFKFSTFFSTCVEKFLKLWKGIEKTHYIKFTKHQFFKESS